MIKGRLLSSPTLSSSSMMTSLLSCSSLSLGRAGGECLVGAGGVSSSRCVLTQRVGLSSPSGGGSSPSVEKNKNAVSSMQLQKRVYRYVAVTEVKGSPSPAFLVTLDNKPLATPTRKRIVFPTKDLAVCVATEWDAQKDVVLPPTMPMMTLMSTYTERYPAHREVAIASLTKYLEYDNICYRAESPKAMVESQERVLQPLVKWMSEEMGIVIRESSGFALEHPESSYGKLRKYLEALDSYRLCAVDVAAGIAHSVTLAVALEQGRITGEQATEAGHLETDVQSSRFGVVEGGQDISRAHMLTNLVACSLFFKLLPPPNSTTK